MAAEAYADKLNDFNTDGIFGVDGLTCTTSLGTGTFPVHAWSFGAVQSGTSDSGGGAGAGKATVSDLNVQRKFDECSPALFGGVTTGKHFTTLTLTQSDKKGPVMIVTLTDILISSYQLSGSQAKAAPTERCRSISPRSPSMTSTVEPKSVSISKQILHVDVEVSVNSPGILVSLTV